MIVPQTRKTSLRAPLFLLAAAALMATVANTIRADAPPAPDGCPSTTTTFDSGDPALPATIDGSVTITSTITVAGLDPFLWDVDLITFIQHTFCGDLDFTLTSPEGTVVTISTDNGAPFGNLFNGTTWDDDAGDTNAPGPVGDFSYMNNGVVTPLAPEEPLGAFIGENPNGDWTLTIADDDMASDDGTLDAWSLILTTLPSDLANTPTHIPTDDGALPRAIVDNNTTTSTLHVDGLDTFVCDINVTTFITHTYSADLNITLTSPAGAIVTLSTYNGGAKADVFNGTVWDDDAGDFNPPGSVTEVDYDTMVVELFVAPEEGLAAFIGEDPNGLWVLDIFDNSGGDEGQLVDWSMDITTCVLDDDDNDGVGNGCDDCIGDDASGDDDGDGICNNFDICDGDNASGDSDGDGVCDDRDLCDGIDATGDSDGDGVCDFSDPCPNDASNDSDGDGVCDSADLCPGFDDNADADNDGIPDGCDPEDNSAQVVPDTNACCGGGAPMMMPFLLIGWSRMKRHRRAARRR